MKQAARIAVFEPELEPHLSKILDVAGYTLSGRSDDGEWRVFVKDQKRRAHFYLCDETIVADILNLWDCEGERDEAEDLAAEQRLLAFAKALGLDAVHSAHTLVGLARRMVIPDLVGEIRTLLEQHDCFERARVFNRSGTRAFAQYVIGFVHGKFGLARAEALYARVARYHRPDAIGEVPEFESLRGFQLVARELFMLDKIPLAEVQHLFEQPESMTLPPIGRPHGSWEPEPDR